jgi:hypothetical protein
VTSSRKVALRGCRLTAVIGWSSRTVRNGCPCHWRLPASPRFTHHRSHEQRERRNERRWSMRTAPGRRCVPVPGAPTPFPLRLSGYSIDVQLGPGGTNLRVHRKVFRNGSKNDSAHGRAAPPRPTLRGRLWLIRPLQFGRSTPIGQRSQPPPSRGQRCGR